MGQVPENWADFRLDFIGGRLQGSTRDERDLGTLPRKSSAVNCLQPPSSGLMNRSERREPCPVAATFLQGLAEGAMWRLPTDVLPPLEQAIAEAEATFREATGKREERSWHKIHTAISTALTSSLHIFSTQACLAVQQGQLTVSEARSGAEQFLKDRANALHGWLVPVMNHHVPGCPYSFRRYNSEDRFVFCRDMVEEVQSSEAWVQFLSALSHPPAALANTAGKTDHAASGAEARPEQPLEAEPKGLAAERDDGDDRRALVNAFIQRVSKETRRRIRRKDIWRVAGYTEATEFQRFQRGKKTTVGSTNKFKKLLQVTPKEFLARLSQLPPNPAK